MFDNSVCDKSVHKFLEFKVLDKDNVRLIAL